MTGYGYKESMFREFCARLHGETSGTVHSYANALDTLDELFAAYNPLGIECSVWDIEDGSLLMEIYRLIKSEERSPSPGLLAAFPSGRSSHLRNRFCSSAVMKFIKFNEENSLLEEEIRSAEDAADLGRRLEKLLISCRPDVNRRPSGSSGQYLFRLAIVRIYGGLCAVTGVSAVPVLTASHISEWTNDTENRLNPSNGICLSATFAAAFDHHLISFDSSYRMMIAPAMRSYLSDEGTRQCFGPYEGKRLILPADSRFLPEQRLLGYHRRQCGL